VRIASWNVNSIRARLDRVVEWVRAQRPDVVCLQETKVQDGEFPTSVFREFGYESVAHGQKSYNGVALLSMHGLTDVLRGFDDGDEEGDGSRLIAATVRGVRVYSAYVPNGQMVGSDAWDRKLHWLARLRRTLEHRHASADELAAVCGDFNVAPEERDVYDPDFWRPTVLFHPEARASLRHLCEFGLVDTLRLHHAEPQLYSWWDYRMLAFPKNKGLRIDLILATRGLAARCTAAGIDREPRKGKLPSDHAPITATFEV
jgi:exodeoxyribonuclease-3